MKRSILPAIALILIALSSATASTFTFTNDPTQFSDSIDWCQYGGCNGEMVLVNTPTPWVSTSGRLTGNAGLFYSSDQFLALQEVLDYPGGFPAGMGLLYNYPGTAGNDFAITFDHLVYGAGAYLEPNYSGPFEASIFLFNSVYNITSSFTWSGTDSGSALFIGGMSSNQDVYGAIFQVVDQYGSVDFILGQASVQAVPEPASMLLVGVSMLGFGFVVRRRRRS